jgi:hypothetical protein
MKYAVIETLDNEVQQVKMKDEHSAAMSLAMELARENEVDPDNDEGEFTACTYIMARVGRKNICVGPIPS